MKSLSPIAEADRKNEALRVLIVEDDPMVADINKRFTEAVSGFKVIGTARNGQQALAFIEQKPVDLMILDIFLPEKSGLEILQELRSKSYPVDVMMITAADDSETVSKVLRCGVIYYIAKPFKFERFRSVLESYRTFRQKTMHKASLNQQDIDSLLTLRPLNAREKIPKNLSTHTMNLIVQYLVAQTAGLSADEIAAGVGLSRVTVRRYMEYLLEQGKVVKVMDYLTLGRPLHRFKLLE